MQSHNRTFSLIKAIGIIAIVASHAAISTPLSPFLFLFNIAIFFFVAGYFFNDQTAARPGLKDGLLFVGRKLRRLYLPFLIIGTLFVLLHNTLLDIHVIAYNFGTKAPIEPYDGSDILDRLLRVALFIWYEQPLITFWFFFGMFTSLVAFFIVTWCSHRLAPGHPERLRATAICTLTLLGALWLKHPLGFSEGVERLVIRTILLLPLLYLGRLYSLYEDRIPLRMDLACLSVMGLLIATWCGYRVNVGGLRFGNPLLFAAITVAGCYMILSFSHLLALRNNKITNTLDYIGRNTMVIMILHVLCFKAVNLLQIWLFDYPIRYLAYPLVIPHNTWLWWLPYTIVGVALPLFISSLWDRLRPRCY